MNNEKILEIARRYTAPETESRILFDKDGNATGGTVTMTYWNFCEEELLAFAQSVIEADRECSNEPVGWLYERCDNPDVYVSPDAAFSWFQEGRYTIPLYTRPVPARKPLSDKEIESIISTHRFAYGVDITAFSFARAVEKKVWEKMHGIGETE